MGRFSGQYKLDIARRFFQCFQQSIGRNVVHAFGWKNQDRFAFSACIGALRKLDGIAHGFNSNFFAGFTRFIVNFSLGFFIQRPAQRQQNGFWHEHKQIGMGMNAQGVTTAALTARTLR